MTLMEFLKSRLDEEEAEAHAAQDVRSDYHAWHQVVDLRAAGMDERDALHIVTHTPARVLAEVAAKRRIMDEHEGVHSCGFSDYDGGDDPCPTLRLLALPYAGHPDCREEWRP